MPDYNAQNPPNSIFPGDLVFPFDAESPTPPQASQQYAIADAYDGATQEPRTISWQISYAAAPVATDYELQAADVDTDASYVTVDTSTNTAGERRQVAVKARFVRILAKSQTGGGAVTASLF